MNKTIQTDNAPPSFSHYSQAVEVPGVRNKITFEIQD